MVNLEYSRHTTTFLNLAGNDLSDRQAQSIAGVLETNRVVKILDMSDNAIADKGFEALATALTSNQTLREMHFAHNFPSDLSAQSFAHNLPLNSTLVILDLSFSQAAPKRVPRIGPCGAKFLSDALPQSSLTKLSLKNHAIKDQGAIAFADTISIGCNLLSLDLRANEIGHEGASRFADTIGMLDQGLLTLSLRENLMANKTLKTLAYSVERRFESHHILTEIKVSL